MTTTPPAGTPDEPTPPPAAEVPPTAPAADVPPTPPTPPAPPVPPAAPTAPDASTPEFAAAPGYATTSVAPVRQTLSLTSFILGLAAFIFSWVPVLGFLAAIAAIILAAMGRKREPQAPSWMWIVGLIGGILGILTSIVVTLAIAIPIIIGFATMANCGASYYSC